MTTTLDPRAVTTIAEDLDRETAEALEWLIAEAGYDRARIHRILGDVRHPIIANWGEDTDYAVCEIVRKVESGTYLSGLTGTYCDAHDLTVEEFNAAVVADPYAYLAAAAAARLTTVRPDADTALQLAEVAYSTSTERAAEEALAASWPVLLTCSWCPRTIVVEAERLSPTDEPWVCGPCLDWA